jgi:hypothetical protein
MTWKQGNGGTPVFIVRFTFHFHHFFLSTTSEYQTKRKTPDEPCLAENKKKRRQLGISYPSNSDVLS